MSMNHEQAEKGRIGKVKDWLRANWQEDTNVGKAKIAAIPVAIFIIVALLWPASPPPPPPATETPIVPGIEEMRRQASEAYESYEARIGELAEEKRAEIGAARQQVVEVYRDYEARIASLEQDNARLSARIQELENSLATREMELATAEVAATMPTESHAAELQEKLEQVRQELERLLESLP
jgi:phage host-nuclease inhibitor protein Gam